MLRSTLVAGAAVLTITVLAPDVVLAQAAPGVESRCRAALDRCLDRAVGKAGPASNCRRAYEACSRRGEQSGTAYRNCMAKAKTSAAKQACRDRYQADR
jgi:hypothetical protein